MSFTKKYDQETQARAVRMVEELIEQGSSQAAARREVGTLLDINPSTLRNWFRRDKGEGVTPAVGAEVHDEEIGRLRRENAKLKKANEILRTASAFFAAAELDRKLGQ